MAFVEGSAVFQQVLEDGTPFPLIFNPVDEQTKDVATLANEVSKCGEWLDSKLAKSGAILFRGFDVSTPEEFNTFVEALGWEEFPYIGAGGAAIRTRVFGKVLTVNEGVPVEQALGFHNEACYLDHFPKRLIFFCEVPPPKGTGGETSIIHGSTVCKRVQEECKEFAEKVTGIRYVSKGKMLSDAMRVYRSPFQKDRAGRLSWFNSVGYFVVIMQGEYDMVLRCGDDIQLATSHDLSALVKIMEEEKIALQWEQGDIFLVDNTAVQHAREGCKAPDRRILVSLTK